MSKSHLDLFSGIGGFAIAAQACGYTTIGFCEREPYAQQILKERFGAVLADAECQHGRHSQRRQHGNSIERTGEGESNRIGGICCPRIHPDIFTLNGADYAGVDLLTGGFPCQPFSVAGKRKGAEDDRALWPEMLRVIGEAKPTWIIGENVNGIVTMELDNILSDLEGLGYAAWPLVVPACAVDARHRRDRVWIIARRSLGDSSSKGLSQRGRSERDTRNTEEGAGMVAEPERSGEDVAHAIGLRELQSSGSFADERGRAGNQGEDVAHANATGRREQRRAEPVEAQNDSAQCGCPRKSLPGGWREVVFAAECDPEGDGLCPCGFDYSDGCSQPGPTQDGYEYTERDGVLYGRPEETGVTWLAEPELGRVAHGIPHRAHRLRGLGNAIVPQVAEEIIRAIASLG